MPRLDSDMESHSIGKGGFAFTGARIERLEATSYTTVTITTDTTGSVQDFVAELEKMERDAIAACKKSPRSDSIMIRLVRFSTIYPNGVEEVIGFKPVADIDVASIPSIRTGGGTPLYDALYAGTSATVQYAEMLKANDFESNAIDFYITDGDDNASAATRAMIKEAHRKAVSGEVLESYISILIGVNTKMYGPYLQQLQQEVGITHYIDVGDATPQKLAKLAAFVSKSVSSQSQAMGTGGPSQNIDLTI